jgi:hypothetical protein
MPSLSPQWTQYEQSLFTQNSSTHFVKLSLARSVQETPHLSGSSLFTFFKKIEHNAEKGTCLASPSTKMADIFSLCTGTLISSSPHKPCPLFSTSQFTIPLFHALQTCLRHNPLSLLIAIHSLLAATNLHCKNRKFAFAILHACWQTLRYHLLAKGAGRAATAGRN